MYLSMTPVSHVPFSCALAFLYFDRHLKYHLTGILLADSNFDEQALHPCRDDYRKDVKEFRGIHPIVVMYVCCIPVNDVLVEQE